MHSKTLAFAIVAFCTPFVFAAPGHKHDDGWSSTQCYTDFGSYPAPHSTEWTTSYRHCTRTHEVTQTVTATAPISTITSTISTSTTVTASTSTLTNTHTNTSTATTTSTTTTDTTTTSTSTTLLASTTVPANPTFQNVQDTCFGCAYNGIGEGFEPATGKRDLSAKGRGERRGRKHPHGHPHKHPIGVKCHEWRHHKCIDVESTTTTTVTISPTTTTTTTSTSTSTLYPSATVTVTVVNTITSTATSTITLTSSTVATSTIPYETVYEACATNNFADFIVIYDFVNPVVFADRINQDYVEGMTTADTPYDCCASVFANVNNGAIFVFTPPNGTALTNNCLYYYYPDSCPLQQGAQWNVQSVYNTDTNATEVTVGNANCGEVFGVNIVGARK